MVWVETIFPALHRPGPQLYEARRARWWSWCSARWCPGSPTSRGSCCAIRGAASWRAGGALLAQHPGRRPGRPARAATRSDAGAARLPAAARRGAALLGEGAAGDRRGVRAARERGLMKLTLLRPASLSALRAALRSSRYDVLHFVGHGGWDSARDGGYLLLDGADGEGGQGQRVSPQSWCGCCPGAACASWCSTPARAGAGAAAAWAPGSTAASLQPCSPPASPRCWRINMQSSTAPRPRSPGRSTPRSATATRSPCGARPARPRREIREAPSWAVPVLYARDREAAPLRPRAPVRERASRVSPRAAPR